MTTTAQHRTLAYVEACLRRVALWRGWTGPDRVILRGMADQAAEMSRRYAVRHAELRRKEGNQHVKHR